METISKNKIDILPSNLTVSTENLWQIINKTISVLIVDINKSTILFANPNSLKELKVIQDNYDLTISTALGKPFNVPITYGEKNELVLKQQNGSIVTIEIDHSLTIWDDKPAYMIIMKSIIKT